MSDRFNCPIHGLLLVDNYNDGCPECQYAESREEQDRLEMKESLSAIAYRRTNPGDYDCPHCKYKSLKSQASRCPLCHGEIRTEYWNVVAARERAEAERQLAGAQAAAAAVSAKAARRKRIEEAALATVRIGLEDSAQRWKEAKKRKDAQGFFSRLFDPAPLPEKVRFDFTTWSSHNGRWTSQPVLIFWGKHFRFNTPFEYIAALTYLRSKDLGIGDLCEKAVVELQTVLDEDWAIGECANIESDGALQDYTGSWQRYREGVARGEAASQHEFGRMYANGQGVPRDYAEALKWYRKAADQGYASSQRIIGFMYANGQAVAQDYGEALKWYRKAADQGYAEAQFSIGVMYAEGEGVSQDYAEALKWYRKAADQDHAGSQRNIGYMYANGQAVAQDYQEALKWYRKAADQGHARAQYSIGQAYHKGQGVPQDYAEAMKWYRKAAAQGNAEAQFNIDLIGGKFDR